MTRAQVKAFNKKVVLQNMDLVDQKLRSTGYIYGELVKREEPPNPLHYIHFELNSVEAITYLVFISSINYISKPRVVKINDNYYTLKTNEENL